MAAASKPTGPAVPLPRPLAAALDANASLASLGQRLAQSRARFEAVRSLLPEALAAGLRPGPIDDESWSLIAPNAAVAAKLRHHLPRLYDALAAQGWPVVEIRVRQASR